MDPEASIPTRGAGLTGRPRGISPTQQTRFQEGNTWGYVGNPFQGSIARRPGAIFSEKKKKTHLIGKKGGLRCSEERALRGCRACRNGSGNPFTEGTAGRTGGTKPWRRGRPDTGLGPGGSRNSRGHVRFFTKKGRRFFHTPGRGRWIRTRGRAGAGASRGGGAQTGAGVTFWADPRVLKTPCAA